MKNPLIPAGIEPATFQSVAQHFNHCATAVPHFIYIYIYRGGERRVQGLVGKPGGKRPLGRPRRRWEDNIKMDLQEVGCGSMDWIELAEDRDRWQALVN